MTAMTDDPDRDARLEAIRARFAAESARMYEETVANYEKFNRSRISMDEMRDQMQFLAKDSGWGFGICSFAGQMAFASQRHDWKSCALFTYDTKVGATREELLWLYAWSEMYNAKMDASLGRPRYSNNPFMFGLELREYGDTKQRIFFHKRASWQSGRYFSPILDEALRFACEATR